MTSLQDLHDPTKTCIAIEAREDLSDSDDYTDYEPFPSRDIPGGYELRLKAYHQAWQKCLNRVKAIVHELNAPLVHKVATYVEDAHSENSILPGLPYPEVPVIGISAPGGNSTILAHVLEALETQDNARATIFNNGRHDRTSKRKAIVSHLHPSNCPSLTGLMKALVTGFVDRRDDEDEDDDENPGLSSKKRKATTSLANYDIRLLVAWYTALLKVQDPGPQLVVVLHDFEQFNVTAIQDMFYICSQHIHRLPLVFLLELSSPSNPSYLHSTFTRSTLALLCLQIVSAPSGLEVVKEVIHRTFFDVEFEPDVMLGPAVLDYIIEYTTRHSASVDILLNIIQLAYLKHFEEPLTLFTHDTLIGSRSKKGALAILQRPESFQFLDFLLARIWHDLDNLPEDAPKPEVDWQQPSASDLLEIVAWAREGSKRQAEHMRLGLQVMEIVQSFVTTPSKSKDHSNVEEKFTKLNEVVRGRVGKDIKALALAIKKLSGKHLNDLLVKIHEFFQSLNARLRHEEELSRTYIVTTKFQIPAESLEDDETDAVPDVPKIHPAIPPLAAGIAKWLTEYLETKIVRLDHGILWDIWNTGMTPFPSELLNPAPRPTIITALLNPYEAVGSQKALIQEHGNEDDADSDPDRQHELWELPDISILFRRYMEAGKRINVFDWYESFVLALETQRQRLRKRELQSQRTRSRKGKGKGKQRANHSDDEEIGFDSKEDEEKWNVQVQARFISALHELDFMGFIKHTNRKADHVMRTVYDIPN